MSKKGQPNLGRGNDSQWRLALLERAVELGSVSQACTEFGISRARFYKYRQRFALEGVAGLESRPPIHKSHPQTTPAPIVEKLAELAVEFPFWAGWRLAEKLAEELLDETPDLKIPSAATVCKILKSRGLSRAETLRQYKARWSAAESGQRSQVDWRTLKPLFQLQIDPGRQLASPRPHFRLCQFVVQVIGGVRMPGDTSTFSGAVYLHAVVDTYTSMAWASLQLEKRSEDAFALLRHEVLVFCGECALLPHVIETPHNRIFCAPPPSPQERDYASLLTWLQAQDYGAGVLEFRAIKANMRSARRQAALRRLDDQEGDTAAEREWKARRRDELEQTKQQVAGWRRYEKCIEDLGAAHRRVTERGAAFSDFAQRFLDTLSCEFLARQKYNEGNLSFEQLRLDLSEWLEFYNQGRPSEGYPNFGQPPAQRLAEFLEQRG